jgi:hypothetical protein
VLSSHLPEDDFPGVIQIQDVGCIGRILVARFGNEPIFEPFEMRGPNVFARVQETPPVELLKGLIASGLVAQAADIKQVFILDGALTLPRRVRPCFGQKHRCLPYLALQTFERRLMKKAVGTGETEIPSQTAPGLVDIL